MRITMCGVASGASTAGAGAAILLEAAGQRLLLDCGNASVNRIVRSMGQREAPDALLFSHLHTDHVVGLPEMLLRFGLEGRTWPRILGPRDTDAYAAATYALVRFLSANPDREPPGAPLVELTPPGDERLVGEIGVRSVAVPHVAHLECLARRFEWDGGSVVYSGDTRDAPEIMTPLAQGADVLIHECYSQAGMAAFLESLPERARGNAGKSMIASHSRVETVAAIARDAGVKTLVLTHLVEQEDPANLHAIASHTFGGTVFVAREGLVIDS
jgi:ribonuclease Z